METVEQLNHLGVPGKDNSQIIKFWLSLVFIIVSCSSHHPRRDSLLFSTVLKNLTKAHC